MTISDRLDKRGWTEQQILQRLYELGHFHNPDSRQGVTKDDLKKLTVDDKPAKEAIKSFQDMMLSTLEEFTQIEYGRDRHATIDGDPGPATLDTLAYPRCGHPDYSIEGDPMQSNWPTACRGKLRFGYAFQKLPGLSEAHTLGAQWASANNWTWAIEDVSIEIAEVGQSSGCHRYAQLSSALGRGVLADAYLATGRCDFVSRQRFNMNIQWPSREYAAAVKSHEDGHTIGLTHNNGAGALMNPAIHQQSIARAGYPNQHDLQAMAARGYRISKNGATPPPRDRLFLPRTSGPTEPDTPAGDLSISGPPAEIHYGGKLIGRLVVVPVKEF